MYGATQAISVCYAYSRTTNWSVDSLLNVWTHGGGVVVRKWTFSDISIRALSEHVQTLMLVGELEKYCNCGSEENTFLYVRTGF